MFSYIISFMSVFINNKSLNVRVRNTDYSKESTLQSILDKLTTSIEHPLIVDLASTEGLALNTTVQSTNSKLDTLNTSVSSVISGSGVNVNVPTATGLLFDGSVTTSAGSASSAVTPVGSLNTIFGVCASTATAGATVNVTVQFSNDGAVWYNSMNNLEVQQNDSIELTFWCASKMFRVAVDQACNVHVLYGSR
jgi:hypothetical protein